MVCPYCSRRIADGSERCEYCGLFMETEKEEEKVPVTPNIWLGTLGGLLGAVLGGAVLFFACRVAGILGAVAGLALSFCTIKGYQLLGRRLDKGGIMICMALIFVMANFVDRLDWAFYWVELWPQFVAQLPADQLVDAGMAQLDVLTAFMLSPSLLNMGGSELFNRYLIHMVVLYGSCALGAYFTLRDMLKKQ